MTGDLARQVLARQPLTGLTIVDSHCHMGPYNGFFIPEPDAETMFKVMDRCGVQFFCFSSHLAIGPDAAAGNDATAAVVRRWPDRCLGYLTVNPHQDPAAEIARWADDPAMLGLKLHPDLHNYPITGEKYRPAWEFADRTNRYVLVHTFAGSPNNDPTMLAEIAARYPRAAVILGHSGAIDPGFERSIAVARAQPNVYLELCGSWMTGAWIARLAAAAGAERVLYGSDCPFIDLRYALGRVVFAPLTDEERALILGQNILRLIARARAALTPALSDGAAGRRDDIIG
jgi:hypothetical protein